MASRFSLLVALAIPLINAQRICLSNLPTTDGHFEFPSPNCDPGNYTGINEYDLGTSLTISWGTDQFPGNLALIQDGGPPGSFLRTLVSNYNETTFQWDGQPAQALSNGDVFFFGWYPDAGTTPAFISDYIRMIDTSQSQSSSTTSATSTATSTSASSTVSATSTSTGSSTTGTGSGTTTTTSQTTTPQPNPSTKNVPIGVGVGVGAAVVLAGTAAFFLIRRRHNKKVQALEGQQQMSYNNENYPYGHGAPTMSNMSSPHYQGTSPPPPFSAAVPGSYTPYQSQQHKYAYQRADATSTPPTQPHRYAEYFGSQQTHMGPVEAPNYDMDRDGSNRGRLLPAEMH